MGKKLIKNEKVDYSNEHTGFAWYGIATQVNWERKVAQMLKMRFENMGAAHMLKEIFVPIEEWEEIVEGRMKKDGTRIKRKIKKSRNVMESGYIFINMIMNNHTWNIVRQTTGVAAWLATKGRPSVIPEEEVNRIKQLLNKGIHKNKVNVDIGQRVKITEGPLKDYEGVIIDMKDENITLLIEQFSNTKIDISKDQIEKIS